MVDGGTNRLRRRKVDEKISRAQRQTASLSVVWLIASERCLSVCTFGLVDLLDRLLF